MVLAASLELIAANAWFQDVPNIHRSERIVAPRHSQKVAKLRQVRGHDKPRLMGVAQLRHLLSRHIFHDHLTGSFGVNGSNNQNFNPARWSRITTQALGMEPAQSTYHYLFHSYDFRGTPFNLLLLGVAARNICQKVAYHQSSPAIILAEISSSRYPWHLENTSEREGSSQPVIWQWHWNYIYLLRSPKFVLLSCIKCSEWNNKNGSLNWGHPYSNAHQTPQANPNL